MLLRLLRASLAVGALIGAQLAFQSLWLEVVVVWIVVTITPNSVLKPRDEQELKVAETPVSAVPFHMRGITSERLTQRHAPLPHSDVTLRFQGEPLSRGQSR